MRLLLNDDIIPIIMLVAKRSRVSTRGLAPTFFTHWDLRDTAPIHADG